MVTELDRTLIEHACARLVVAYALHYDSHDTDGFVALWSDDGVWHNSRGALRGPDAIREYLRGPPKITLGRHVCSNIHVTVVDAEHATGTCYFTFYGTTESDPVRPVTLASAQAVGQYFDEYVKTFAGWRFASRRMEPVFKFG
jgi:hypothetical protein